MHYFSSLHNIPVALPFWVFLCFKGASVGKDHFSLLCLFYRPFIHSTLVVFPMPVYLEAYSLTVTPGLLPACSGDPRDRRRNSYLRTPYQLCSPRFLLSSGILPFQILLKLFMQFNHLNLWRLVWNLDKHSQSWKRK